MFIIDTLDMLHMHMVHPEHGLKINWDLQFPGCSDHQIKIRIKIDAGTYPTVVVHKFIFGDLKE